MEPRNVIVGKNRATGKLEVLSDVNEPILATENGFMPFRLARENAQYEWAALCSLDVQRLERFTIPTDAPSLVPEQSTKKAKSK